MVVWIVILGVVCWLVNAYAPMGPGWKKLVTVILIVCACLITLHAFGLLGDLNATVPKLR